jgi:hypothetical protein
MARDQQAAPNKLKEKQDEPLANSAKLSREIDRLESRLEELRVCYEQHFIDILPQAPDAMRKEVARTIRLLLKAPFKNSQTRFRLRTVIHRYQTYSSYWERILKEREEGRFVRDLFKSEMREKSLEEAKKDQTQAGKAERGLKQLYSTYEEAIRKTGGSTDSLNFDSFKNNLIEKAKQMKDQHGVKKLHYKVQVKDGRVILKATPK